MCRLVGRYSTADTVGACHLHSSIDPVLLCVVSFWRGAKGTDGGNDMNYDMASLGQFFFLSSVTAKSTTTDSICVPCLLSCPCRRHSACIAFHSIRFVVVRLRVHSTVFTINVPCRHASSFSCWTGREQGTFQGWRTLLYKKWWVWKIRCRFHHDMMAVIMSPTQSSMMIYTWSTTTVVKVKRYSSKKTAWKGRLQQVL